MFAGDLSKKKAAKVEKASLDDEDEEAPETDASKPVKKKKVGPRT